VAVADDLGRLIALREVGHLSNASSRAAKDAVLGQTQLAQPISAAPATVVIPEPPSGDEARPPLATDFEPTERSRRPLLVALALLIVLLAGCMRAPVASRSTPSQASTAASPTAASPTAASSTEVAPEASASPVSLNALSFKDASFVKEWGLHLGAVASWSGPTPQDLVAPLLVGHRIRHLRHLRGDPTCKRLRTGRRSFAN